MVVVVGLVVSGLSFVGRRPLGKRNVGLVSGVLKEELKDKVEWEKDEVVEAEQWEFISSILSISIK